MNTLAQLLRKARLSKDVTLKEASTALGMPLSNLHSLERGYRTNPKMDTLYRLADYYGISIDEICISCERVPSDVFYKICKHPKLLQVIREWNE